MLRSVLFTALLAFSASASAQGFNYDYFSVGYSQIEVDTDGFGGNIDGDAFGAAGSWGISDSFVVFGSFQTGELEDDVGASADVTLYDLGLGYVMPLSETIDLIGSVSYEYQELSESGFSIDENGYGLGLALRAMAGQSVELNAGIQYVDLGDVFEDETSLNLGALYSVTDNIQVGLAGTFGDDVTFYTLNGRFFFGNN